MSRLGRGLFSGLELAIFGAGESVWIRSHGVRFDGAVHLDRDGPEGFSATIGEADARTACVRVLIEHPASAVGGAVGVGVEDVEVHSYRCWEIREAVKSAGAVGDESAERSRVAPEVGVATGNWITADRDDLAVLRVAGWRSPDELDVSVADGSAWSAGARVASTVD